MFLFLLGLVFQASAIVEKASLEEPTGTYCKEEDGTQRCEYEATNCKYIIVITNN